MSSSGIFNQSGRNCMKKADAQSFDQQQMPDELATFHAFHVVTPTTFPKSERVECNEKVDSDEEDEQLKVNTKSRRRSSNLNDDVRTDSDEDYQMTTRDKNRKVQFTKLVKSKSASEWEDVGSQTDHSEVSEGHYSDETCEEKNNRELRNRTKFEKRVRRLAIINRKHKIVE